MIDRLRLHMDKGEWLTVKRLVSGLLATDDIPPLQKTQAGLYGAQAAMFLREPFLSASFAQKALALAQEFGEVDLEGRALFQLAAAKLAIGDNAEARIYIHQFIGGLVDRWGSLETELGARAYGNLGMILRNQRLYPDSLKAYWQAAVRLERIGDIRGQVICHHQTAWVLILTGAYDDAAEYLDKAAAMGELPAELAAHQLTHEALLYLRQGSYALATQKAEEVLQPERPHVGPSSKAVACYVMGEAAYQTGQVEVARTFATLAREAALEDGLASLLNMVSSLLRAVEAARLGIG
jgi:tetratricopeptide (TPR) repeat protein